MPVETLSKKARKKAEGLLTANGVDDYIWIDPRRIVTAQWVKPWESTFTPRSGDSGTPSRCAVLSRMSKTATDFC